MSAELSQYQTVFRVSKNGNSAAQAGKRNRKPVSCLTCRTRKTKCDRQLPCIQCIKLGEGHCCSYAGSRFEREEAPKASEVQVRLRKLEEMVNTLLSSKDQPEIGDITSSLQNPADNQSIYQPRQGPESSHSPLHANVAAPSYLGATHWRAILEDIRDIQVVLKTEVEDAEEIPRLNLPKTPDILIDTTNSLTLTDICNSLPPRHVADELISLYFNSKHKQAPIIHTAKFSRELKSFRANPASVSFLWISILFSVLHSARRIVEFSGKELEGPTSAEYISIAGRALVVGEYLKARPYSVEAVILYAVGKLLRQEDGDVEAWMIMSIGSRLAMKMGYHRDPRYLKGISPFEGEMRRRTFFVIEALELLLSFRAGLPPIIHEDDYDTALPSNLLDTDFDEDCASLPPSRPLTHPTPMLYCCCKCEQVRFMRRVSRHALSLKPPSYEATMNLDRELHNLHANLPSSVRINPTSPTITDNPMTAMSQFSIELIYLRCVCVLHRNYLSYDKSNPAYDYSRRVCTEAALQTLRYEAAIHMECQPGGVFHDNRWLISNLMIYDFLLAAMIICLDLYETRNKLADASPEELKIQNVKYDALERARAIWKAGNPLCGDTRHAANVLTALLSKVPRPNIPPTPPTAVLHMPTNTSGSVGNSGPLSYTATSSSSLVQDLPIDNNAPDPSSGDPLELLFTESSCIDWELIDQFLYDRTSTFDVPSDWELMDSIEGPPTT